MFIPHGDTLLESTDTIYLFGEQQSLRSLSLPMLSRGKAAA